jgi:hypothetical protein
MEKVELQNVSIQLKNGKKDKYSEVLSVENDSEYITIIQKQPFETYFYRRKMNDIQAYVVEKC